MSDPLPLPGLPDDEESEAPPIGDASLLFGDSGPGEAVRPGAKPPAPAPDEVYEVAPAATPPMRPTPAPAAEPPASPISPPRPAKPQPRPRRPEEDDEDTVEPVWSKWAESGVDGLRFLAVAAFTLVLTFQAFAWLGSSVGLFVLILGLIAMAVALYPLLITLERPFRVTPEQAVRDYLGALSHAFPHDRRMWLLLSDRGRGHPAFGGRERLKAYWRHKREGFLKARGLKWSPVLFELVDFRSEKSAGQDRIVGRGTVRVSVYEGTRPEVVAEIPATFPCMRGPDRMWYLQDGTLPDAEGEPA